LAARFRSAVREGGLTQPARIYLHPLRQT